MMSRLSLLDKLKILSDVTSSSGLFAVAILFFVVLAFLFIATSRKAKKISFSYHKLDYKRLIGTFVCLKIASK